MCVVHGVCVCVCAHICVCVYVTKVEIGGDAQSTDGAEASHWHSLNPPMHSCAEGYEFWLLQVSTRRLRVVCGLREHIA